MKKLLSIGLVGIVSVAALAVESDPSNTVGFISQEVVVGFSPFGVCPSGTATGMAAADLIGGQGVSGDKIYLNNGTAWVGYSWTADGTWGGATGIDYNDALLYLNSTAAPSTVVVAGDVIPEGTALTMGVFAVNNFNAWGNPLPLDIDLDSDDLTLAADGFVAGDKIYKHNGTAWVSFTYNGTIYGGLVLDAGEGFLVRPATAAVTWDYTVGAAPLAVVNNNRVAKGVKAVKAGNIR